MIGDKPANGNYAKAQNAYHDFQGLRELKKGAVEEDPEALKEVARQFEALFIQMILKSARDADELIGGEESLMRSKEMSFFQGMMDEQFSIAMTQSNGGEGLGIADVLVKQLAKAPKEAVGDIPEDVRRGAQLLTEDAMQQINNRRLRFTQPPLAAAANTPSQDQDRQAAAQALQAAQRPPMTAATDKAGRKPLEIEGLPVSADKRAYFASPEDFVRHVYPLAQKAAARIGVDPKLMVAQTALETGWGKFMIPRKDGTSSFNLFNIKADQRWDGEAAEVQTLEFRNGQPQQERWPFRAYDSLDESIDDYIDFLTANPRYQQALEKAADSQAFAKGLQQAGYATDPRYARKIINIMDGSTLNQALENIDSQEAQQAPKAVASKAAK
ncbi:flagellar assembly peptidoglycan hydrolase FlgJ [Marinospirillum insulare]|uniref:Peptidoglycan hydrolase FlgJ n=1 Tax=Marinospirillum insulare TaxID=217169 RepID=A0ABQ5ZTK5_9GAMM|nr:flagellar assembly peptidoglycan hydrolase FlgJ [Marinospirillum insulare]GLR63319.1 peptidoglycan hydrolase FlgJ [Marinospirillum insulare]